MILELALENILWNRMKNSMQLQKGFRSIVSLYSIAKKTSSNLILHKLYERPSASRILWKIAIWHPFTIKDLISDG